MSIYVFAIDGPDGVGKSTLITELLHYFNQYTSYNAIKLSPTSGEFGSQIKHLVTTTEHIHPEVEKRLLLAGMKHVEYELVRYLTDGNRIKSTIVLLDRWLPSHHIYQYYLRQSSQSDVYGFQKVYTPDNQWMELHHTFILDAPDTLLDSRLSERQQRDKFEDDAIQPLIRKGYRGLVDTEYFKGKSSLVDVSGTLDENKNKLIKMIINRLS